MIREITIPAALLKQEGLQPQSTTLRDLGATVLFAGPNGAGKTRFLRSVISTIKAANQWQSVKHGYESLVESFRAQLADPKTPDPTKQGLQTHLVNRETYAGLKVEGDAGPELMRQPQTVIELTYDLKQRIQNANHQVPARIEEGVTATAEPGFTNAYQHAHEYVSVVARRLFNAEHPSFEQRAELQVQKQDAEEFNAIVTSLLGAPVGWTVHAGTGFALPLLMRRKFQETELSAGQKILLAWAIILHRQRAHLSNTIVIIDEPENHLHPDVCIRALDRLQKDVLGERGQIWLATHSIPLIAWAGFPSIHFVQDGTVGYAGNRVDEVVEGLLGGEDGRHRLRGFLADAEELAVLKFAAECLTEPAVAYSRGNDPQEVSFAKLVADRAGANRPLRLLDYGAGTGRLAAAIAAARRAGAEGAKLPPLQYLATDRGLCDPACQHNLDELRAQADVEARYVADTRELRGQDTKVDVVVLCNVLHEIPVPSWLQTFAELDGILAPEGCVILMEDQTPSVGELPNRRGFVILDAIETKRLFGDDPSVRGIPTTNPRWEHRLTMIEVPRAALSKATSTTIGQALGDVQERAEKRIGELREDPPGRTAFQIGRLHALYAMLWVNAMMAARTFGVPPR